MKSVRIFIEAVLIRVWSAVDTLCHLPMRTVPLVFILMCLTLLASCDSFKRHGIAPGDSAPDITANTLDGKPFSLTHLSGKVVLVNFWATWCGPCVQELPALERLQQRFGGNAFTVIGVAIDDDPESIGQFRAEYGLSFPIINDSKGASKQSYKLTGVPETVLLDKAGKVVMFIDPESSEPVSKVSGPREWDSQGMIAQIEKLIQ